MEMENDLFAELCNVVEPDAIVLFDPADALVDAVAAQFPDIMTIVASSRNPPAKFLMARNIAYRKISTIPSPGIGVLLRLKDFFTAAMGEGLLHPNQHVACCCEGDVSIFMEMNTSNMGIPSIAEAVGDRVDLRIVDMAMEAASEIAREGKEGYPVGALFVLGDEQKVLLNSKELVRNPFQSHVGSRGAVTLENDSKSIKQFALLDGAVVLDGGGRALSAGRYIMVHEIPSLSIEEGQGGRHLAAAYITRATKALAIVVSSTGVIRVFKDGSIIYEVKNV